MTRPTTFSRRRLLWGGLFATGTVLLASCGQEEDETSGPPSPSAPPANPVASNLALQAFWRSINNAARTLGAVVDVRFSRPPFGMSAEERTDRLLTTAGIGPSHRNYDIIRDLYMLGVGSVPPAYNRLTVSEFDDLRALAEPVLESAYKRALGECRLNMPTCNIDITTRFKPPGTPGGAPDWATAWWDFSSP